MSETTTARSPEEQLAEAENSRNGHAKVFS